jgi:flagellar biosynthesis protein FlhF
VQLRRFKGRALPDVVRQVKAELGPNAVILHTKADRPRGLLRFLHGAAVEVVAAVDQSSATAPRVPAEPGGPKAPAPAAMPAPASALDVLQTEIADLRRILLRFGGARGLPSPLVPLYAWLVEAGVDDALAFRLLDDMAVTDASGITLNIETLTEALEKRVSGAIRVCGASLVPARGTIAFVGPTGAGKTTTVAKLAVRAHLEGRTPQVVSLDGLGPATPAALEAIARVAGVPHEVAATPAEVESTLGRSAAEIRLIDTPGLVRGDTAGVAALAALLRHARVTEVHFVIPATMKADDALATLAAFAPLGANRLLVTKLDETATFGSLLTVAVGSGLPLSYVATGRDVPDDIQAATARDLSRRVVRRERS